MNGSYAEKKFHWCQDKPASHCSPLCLPEFYNFHKQYCEGSVGATEGDAREASHHRHPNVHTL